MREKIWKSIVVIFFAAFGVPVGAQQQGSTIPEAPAAMTKQIPQMLADNAAANKAVADGTTKVLNDFLAVLNDLNAEEPWLRDGLTTVGKNQFADEAAIADLQTKAADLQTKTANLQTTTAALQAAVANIPASSTVLPRNVPANAVNQFGAFPSLTGFYLAPASGQGPNLAVATVSGGVYGSGIAFGGTSGASGSFFEYTVNVPDDGRYKIGAQMAITSGGIPLGFHYEAKGVNVSGPLNFASPDTGPHFFEAGPFALTAGPQVLRVAIDSVPANFNRVYILYWLRLVKQ